MSRKFHPTPASREIYGNVEVYHPSGSLMFRCSEKRARWYLNKGLAAAIQWGDEPGIKSSWRAIKLTFVPKGDGNASDPYYRQVHLNRCVVCGSEDRLQRHHVVPLAYRKCFPEPLKSHNHHDVLPICADCKHKYNPHIDAFMKQLAREHGVEPSGEFPFSGDKHRYHRELKAKMAACALVGPHRDKIPQARKDELMEIVECSFEHIRLDRKGLEWVAALPGPSMRPSGAVVVETMLAAGEVAKTRPGANGGQWEALQGLVLAWRGHFIRHCRPQFMPEHWDICRV